MPRRLAISRLLILSIFGTMLPGSVAQELHGPSTEPVQVTGGTITGIEEVSAKVDVYLGIPFAAPPVGDLRWREPQPVKSFGNLKADHYRPSCIQRLVHSRPPYVEPYMTQNDISENCLYLNVWAPEGKAAKPRPVLVWFFGGGFAEGSGECPLYDGTELAKRDIIVVTFNYRLGQLGFLAHPELTAESPHHSSGNYGLMDQSQALHWVRENIKSFGGDPAHVAIFGQSAGALSIHSQMLSPMSRGTFSAAFAMSGVAIAGMISHTLAEAEQLGGGIAEAHGTPTLKELRSLPAEDFIPSNDPKAASSIHTWPIVDGSFFAGTAAGIRAWQSDVPFITGLVANDHRLLARAPTTVDEFQEMASTRYGSLSTQFLKAYPVNSDPEVSAALDASGRDRGRMATYEWAARAKKISKAPIWLYYFDHPLPDPQHLEFGAFHGAEIPYIFRNLKLFQRPFSSEDCVLQDNFSGYLRNLALHHDPNGAGLPEWKAYRKGETVTMRIGSAYGSMPIASSKVRFDFWDAYYRENPIHP